MATKRTPIKRKTNHHITPAALAAYRHAREIEATGAQEKWEVEGGRKRDWYDAWMALHHALGLKPWETNPLDVDDGPAPAWVHDIHGWERAQEFQRQLEECLLGGSNPF